MSKMKRNKHGHVLIEESFSICKDTETLTLRVTRVDKEGILRNSVYTCISNTTADTNRDHLLREGIESNPGPTPMNEMKSPGRKRKRGFQNHLNSTVSQDSSNIVTQSIDNTSGISSAMPMLRNNPIGLTNSGENICFLNCVVQIFYTSIAY